MDHCRKAVTGWNFWHPHMIMWHATNDECCAVLIKPASKQHANLSHALFNFWQRRTITQACYLICVYYILQRVEVRFKKDDIHGKDVDIVGRMKGNDEPSSERCPTPHEMEPSYYKCVRIEREDITADIPT